ncbi:hypothetical protein [Streptomyces sp. NRRL S-350]|uniref:hypothetical protein n=1 Tax=Streptomyces sp. NRRL S-350 TaxID=1463902 RepID=UPI0004C1F799|nr:hypothetical protein [Streptomyces sp. NRRL S-350]
MDEGGESACWLDRVCPECGRLRERPGPQPCENCGAESGDAPADPAPPTEASPDTPPHRTAPEASHHERRDS